MDIVNWIVQTGATIGALTPLVMAMVKAAEKFGLSGNVQLGFALVFGGGTGAFASVALNGVPTDVLGWFLLFLTVVMMAGVPVGTYEAIKGAKSDDKNAVG